MVAIVALLAAAVLLVVGWSTDSDPQLIAACVLAGLVALVLIADRLLARVTSEVAEEAGVDEVPDAAGVEPASVTASTAAGVEPTEAEPRADVVEDSDDSVDDPGVVVFVPGRMTFHRSDCRLVADKNVGRGSRADLEGAGMNACRSCLRA